MPRIAGSTLATTVALHFSLLPRRLRDCAYRVIVTSNASEVHFPQSSDPGEATFLFTTRAYGAADSSRPTPHGASTPGFKGATAPRDDKSSKQAPGADESKPTAASGQASEPRAAKHDSAAAAADRPDQETSVQV